MRTTHECCFVFMVIVHVYMLYAMQSVSAHAKHSPPAHAKHSPPAHAKHSPPDSPPAHAKHSPPAQSLRVGYYHSTCPEAEAIVKASIYKFVSQNRGLAAGLIRMHFHDCFVRGCDGSVLLASTPRNPAERDHPTNNPSLRGFQVIDDAKAKLEAKCPGVVSCADVLAFAARDSSFMAGKINYAVPAGRRDGRISRFADAGANLPSPTLNVTGLRVNFATKGLTLEEMVTLSGSHSIGLSRCGAFSSRLYSFNSTTPQDPSLDPVYAAYLRTRCPPVPPPGFPTEPLDIVTPDRLDNVYYKELSRNRGLLTSDQTLFNTPSTNGMVWDNIRRPYTWAAKFAAAMVRMGYIEVITSPNEGEIRRVCSIVN